MDARYGNSGKVCGKNGTQRHTRALAVRHMVRHECRGAEAVLASIRFKLVTASMEIDASGDRQESAIAILSKCWKV